MKARRAVNLSVMLGAAALVLLGCGPETSPSNSTPSGFGQRTKFAGCVARNGLPDAACTPGAIFPDATLDLICTPGYTKGVRLVPDQEKNEVYAEYGIVSRAPGEYEVDHLISLELGGSNDIANLWPELASPQPGFHQKDQLENALHKEVCSGATPLRQAQLEIAADWLALYRGGVR
jgi:hypothetical protein